MYSTYNEDVTTLCGPPNIVADKGFSRSTRRVSDRVDVKHIGVRHYAAGCISDDTRTLLDFFFVDFGHLNILEFVAALVVRVLHQLSHKLKQPVRAFSRFQ